MVSRRLPIVVLLLAEAILLGWAASHSPVFDESPHVAAGVSKWRFGRWDLYRVNPPLTEMVGAAPVVAVGCEADWTRFSERHDSRAEFPIGRDFATANGRRTLWLLRLARLAFVPLVLAGGWVCCRWGRDMWGPGAGLAAAALWCFSPTVLGNGALVTPDAAAASLGLLASYLFWCWLREPTWGRTATAGIGLGLALLTKFTWLVLVPLWLVVWIGYRLLEPRPDQSRDHQGAVGREVGVQRNRFLMGAALRQAVQVACVMLLALYVINAGYGFEHPFRPLNEFDFISDSLKDDDGPTNYVKHRLGNRFRGSVVGSVPVPIPANYLIGIDVQKADFERATAVYVHENRYPGGVWYWYLYALAVKEPVGLWVLVAVVLFAAPLPKGRDLLVLLAPAVAVLVLVSWNHSLCHYRYVLPAWPFLFVFASGAANVVSRTRPVLSAIVVGSIMWYAGSSLAVAPHWLSYFNEFAGGPKNGWRHLSGSALDWGQGLIDLKNWLDEHPEAQPLHLAYVGNFDPRLVGIEFELPPTEPEPGWYAISANFLADADRVIGTDGEPQSVPQGAYAYFRQFEPVYRAADVLYVYHVTPADAERVR